MSVIARVDSPKGPMVLIGLERGNLDKLQAGQPYNTTVKDLNANPVTIVILFGETQEDIIKQIEPYTDDKTRRYQVPRKKP